MMMRRPSVIVVAAVFGGCEGHGQNRSVWMKPELKSGLVFIVLTFCVFRRMMANADHDIYNIASEYLFQLPC